MDLHPRVFVSFYVRGRSKKGSHTRLSFSSAVSTADVSAAAIAFVEKIAPLVDGAIDGFTLAYDYFNPDDTLPDATDIQAYLMLFYTNELQNVEERIDIPSPLPSLFETEGDYAGIRLNATEEIVTLLNDLVIFTCTPEGDPWPPFFDVGGLAL